MVQLKLHLWHFWINGTDQGPFSVLMVQCYNHNHSRPPGTVSDRDNFSDVKSKRRSSV